MAQFIGGPRMNVLDLARLHGVAAPPGAAEVGVRPADLMARRAAIRGDE